MYFRTWKSCFMILMPIKKIRKKTKYIWSKFIISSFLLSTAPFKKTINESWIKKIPHHFFETWKLNGIFLLYVLLWCYLCRSIPDVSKYCTYVHFVKYFAQWGHFSFRNPKIVWKILFLFSFFKTQGWHNIFVLLQKNIENIKKFYRKRCRAIK